MNIRCCRITSGWEPAKRQNVSIVPCIPDKCLGAIVILSIVGLWITTVVMMLGPSAEQFKKWCIETFQDKRVIVGLSTFSGTTALRAGYVFYKNKQIETQTNDIEIPVVIKPKDAMNKDLKSVELGCKPYNGTRAQDYFHVVTTADGKNLWIDERQSVLLIDKQGSYWVHNFQFKKSCPIVDLTELRIVEKADGTLRLHVCSIDSKNRVNDLRYEISKEGLNIVYLNKKHFLFEKTNKTVA